VLGMGIVTYLPRWIPLIFLSRRRLPEWLRQWLDFILAAVLSALILPALVTTGEPRHLTIISLTCGSALPTVPPSKQQPFECNCKHIITPARALSRILSQQTGIYWGMSGNTEPLMVEAIGCGVKSASVKAHGIRSVE